MFTGRKYSYLLLFLCCGLPNILAVNPWERPDVIKLYKVSSKELCQRLCWYRQSCVSFSYTTAGVVATPNGENCVLHSQAAEAVLPEGWVSGNANVGQLSNGCASRPCGEKEVCVPAPSGQHNCLHLSAQHWQDPTHVSAASTTVVDEQTETPTTSLSTPSSSTAAKPTSTPSPAPQTNDSHSIRVPTQKTTTQSTTSQPKTERVSESTTGPTTTTLSMTSDLSETRTASTDESTTVVQSGTTTPRIGPACPPPPLLERTDVSRSFNGTHDKAHYSCSVTTDVYIKGTTDVICSGSEGTWPTVTILCAPTTCYYIHSVWDAVYAGTLTNTRGGKPCDRWDKGAVYMNERYTPDSVYTVDGSRTAAKNYCRTFGQLDGYYSVWCFSSQLVFSLYWDYCDVPECPSVPGTLLN